MGSKNHHPARPVSLPPSSAHESHSSYFLSLAPLKALSIPPTPLTLRLTNLVLSTIIIPFLLSVILEALSLPPPQVVSSDEDTLALSESRPERIAQKPNYRAWVDHLTTPCAEALVVASFPLVVFFGGLYYTDVGSLAGVLGAWALGLRGLHPVAAIVRRLASRLSCGRE